MQRFTQTGPQEQMNMSKLTQKKPQINNLKGHYGINLRDIPNLTEWVLSYKPAHSTKELVDCLLKNGVIFNSKHHVSELCNYMPPKKSIGLSLSPYLDRLHALYLENYRQAKLDKLTNKITQLDLQVFSQWVQNIHLLDGLKKTALRSLALYHPDKHLIQQTKEQAYYAYRAEVQLGIEYNDESLFTTLIKKPSSEPAESMPELTDDNAEALEVLLDVVKEQKEMIAKLCDEVEQIKTLLDIKVKDILRAVK